jgi:hypothetical protein
VSPFRPARLRPQERVREQRTKSVSSGRGGFEAPPPFALTPLTGRDTYDLRRPELLALFAKLLFLPPDERYSGTGLTPAREREETFRALSQWLRAYSGKRPILLVVEDLHWIDASTLEFLGHFIGEGPHDRILTVLTFRPEFKTPWPAPAHQTTLALNRLTRRQVAEWMRRDAGAALPESLVAQIYRRTSGVPLLEYLNGSRMFLEIVWLLPRCHLMHQKPETEVDVVRRRRFRKCAGFRKSGTPYAGM